MVNNWYPGEILDLPAYTEKRVDVLAARAFQAFHEWQPVDQRRAVDGRLYRSFGYGPNVDIFILDMRTYKDPNTSPKDGIGHVLGERQARWLVDGLARSRATWKIIAADLPIGLIVPDGADIEGVANGLPGAPGAREHELAWVLRELARRRVRNVVWLTADVHYTAAHHYSPEREVDFDPFLGDSSPDRCTPVRSGRTRWIPRSAPRRCSCTPRPPRTCRRWTTSSTSARSRWTATVDSSPCTCATAEEPCSGPRP